MAQDMFASIIIRTKNEEAWIGRCLERLRIQDFGRFEVIVVDSGSTDDTLEIVAAYPECRVIEYEGEYRPGRALNAGCMEARGDWLVFLSAHCLPVNEQWLRMLLKGLEEPLVAGVYGKQEPMEDTDPYDKRDLIITFGLDRRVQWNDPFFHNANSAARRSLWEQFPFNEEVTNIEDRVWAASVQKAGYCIIYEPEARVFHYHGIHQTLSATRCMGVNHILANLHHYVEQVQDQPGLVQKDSLIAVIPFSSEINRHISARNVRILFDILIRDLYGIELLSDICLLTDSRDLAEHARVSHGHVRIPYLRQDDSNETLLSVLREFTQRESVSHGVSILLCKLIFLANDRNRYMNEMCSKYMHSESSSAIWIAPNNNSIFTKNSGGILSP